MSAPGGLVSGATALTALVAAEVRWPLRRAVEPKVRRMARNVALSALTLGVVQLVELPLLMPLAALVVERGWGLLHAVDLPRALEVGAALVLLDYTLYLWHVLTHRVPALWRFHVVHHTDLDMDASTALRFHFAEYLVSVPARALQLVLIGVSPTAFATWQGALFASTLFHHSNLRLPIALERRLCWLVVTPRLHGIHHSIVRAETDANWSSGLTLWDRLHGTLRLDVPQDDVTIGVPAFRAPADVRLGRLLALPFVRQPDTRRLPDGTVPARPPVPARELAA